MTFKVKIEINKPIFYINANNEKELKNKIKNRIKNLIQFEITAIEKLEEK